MTRPRKVKYNAIRITIESVISTTETGSEDVEDSIERALDDLCAFGMAKVVKTEPTEYPDYETFNKDAVRHIDYNGSVSIYVG